MITSFSYQLVHPRSSIVVHGRGSNIDLCNCICCFIRQASISMRIRGSVEKPGQKITNHDQNLQPKTFITLAILTEAGNEWQVFSPRLSAWATQLRRNLAAVVSRGRHSVRTSVPRIEPKTFRVGSDIFNHYTKWPALMM